MTVGYLDGNVQSKVRSGILELRREVGARKVGYGIFREEVVVEVLPVVDNRG